MWRVFASIFLIMGFYPHKVALAAKLIFTDSTRDYVIIKLDPNELREKPDEFCFFTKSKEKIGCGKVTAYRGNKAVIKLTDDVRSKTKKNLPAVKAKNGEVNSEDLNKIWQRYKLGGKADRKSRKNAQTAEPPEPSGTWEVTGSLDLQTRYFTKVPLHDSQEQHQYSAAIQPSIRYRNADESSFYSFIPYVRADNIDNRKTFDIKELEWIGVGKSSEIRLGVRRVFWGVVESQHLVDTINQIDVLSDPLGDEKLGQPMANFAWIFEQMGTIEFYIMPMFRERPLPGEKDRLRGPIGINDEDSVYESKEKDKHVDWASRYSVSFSGLDLGLSYFSGTNRAPDFIFNVAADGKQTLIPYYRLMHQVGLDLQWALEGWLIKAEAINRNQVPKAYQAWVYGIEYGFNGIAGTAMDLSFFAEHNRDSRSLEGQQLQNDVFLGSRLAVNNLSSLEVLAGVIFDTHYETKIYNIESSRRIGEFWKISIQAQGSLSADEEDRFFYDLRNDDYLQMKLTYFY